MKQLFFAVMLAVFFSPHPVWAEMYRYKDAGGVIRFTDNLADVPEKQRAGASVYEDVPVLAVPSSTGQPSGQDTPIGQSLKIQEKPQVVDSPSDRSDVSKDPSRIEQLLKIKTALDNENAQFMKESLALSEEKKTLSGNAAINAYNEKVSALNARVADYESRRAAFQKEVEAFDAGLKKRLAPAP